MTINYEITISQQEHHPAHDGAVVMPTISHSCASEIEPLGLRAIGADVINAFGHRTRGDAHMPAWYPGAVQSFILNVEAPWTDVARIASGDGMDNTSAERAGDAAAFDEFLGLWGADA